MPLFQVDLDTEYLINQQNVGNVRKTVRELIALAQNQNLGDSIILKKYMPTDQVWYVVPFYKKTTESNVYYGTTSYLSYSTTYANYVGIGNNIFQSPNSRQYQYNLAQNGTLRQGSAFEFYTKQINGITYFILGMDNQTYYENIGYYVPDVSMVYIDNVPQVTYNWQSVPSISGKNGILSLVTLDSESINDGEPVSGAAVSVFDQAPSNDNNIKNLADTYGGGEESSAVDVTVKYKLAKAPTGSYNYAKLVAKKGSVPQSPTDGNKIVDISPSKTKKTVSGLDENSTYHFKIFTEDGNGSTAESESKHISTSEIEGNKFAYTGAIQTFVVPESGMYSLETWGAQGQGEGSARGGYGAYAYAEAFLTEG